MNNKRTEYFLISESKWRQFTSDLTSGEYICTNAQAMYGPLIIDGKTNAHALYLLCEALCKLIKKENILNTFIKKELILNSQSDTEDNKYDIPNNDWKNYD